MKRLLVAFLILLAAASMCGGREIVVNSTSDSGTGTLRRALQTAQSGDVITFDPGTFPSDDPAMIHPRTNLPFIEQGQITIDASSAGVIVNGDQMMAHEGCGLIITSDHNTIQGLQIVNFPGSGIVLIGANDNLVGGDRAIGIGPIGQGNVLSGNSGAGLAAWDRPSSRNLVIGNVIGSDVAGEEPWPNGNGIFLADGATDNVIGPGNTIAYNHEHGVVVRGSDSVRNMITQNVFRENSSQNILLLDGGNGGLLSPSLMSFDLQLGKVRGFAVPGSIIEFFSAETDGRYNYEGTVATDEAGSFVFDKGSPFSGGGLISTATDLQGNTSPFSNPSSEQQRDLNIQEENWCVPTQLPTGESLELDDNRIGPLETLFAPDFTELEVAHGVVNRTRELGLSWVQFFIEVPDGEEVGQKGGFTEHRVTDVEDSAINNFLESGIEVILGLVFWDEITFETIPANAVYSFYKTQDEVDRYLDYVRFIVRHFNGRIQYYSILNEPDIGGAPGERQHVDVSDYLNLIRQVVPIIRMEDPQARIVIPNVSRTAFPESRDYLFTILGSDVMSLVDVVQWHGMDCVSPEYEIFKDHYYGYPSMVRAIRQMASDHGFTGEYLGGEIHYRILGYIEPDNPARYETNNPWVYSEREAAKYYARAMIMQLGLDIGVTFGGEWANVDSIISMIRNICTVMAGHEAIDMPVEIDVDYDGPIAYCTFRYPNGDRMLAVWTDGIAQDEDPGAPATITFPGLAAGRATGINVLHGFEQELAFETDGASTTIRDLLVKDYPILIRLSDVTMSEGYEEAVGDGFHQLGDIDIVPNSAGGSDRDGDGVPDDKDFCPDWPGSSETSGC